MRTVYLVRDVFGAAELEEFLNDWSSRHGFELVSLLPFEFEGGNWITAVIRYREEVKG